MLKLKNNTKLLITCDSGAAAGKTTAAKYLSKKFGLQLLTSGLLYRFMAFKILKSNKNKINSSLVKKIAKNINSKSLKNSKLYSPAVTEYTVKIAKIYMVRKILRNYQNKFSKKILLYLRVEIWEFYFRKLILNFFLNVHLILLQKEDLKNLKK